MQLFRAFLLTALVCVGCGDTSEPGGGDAGPIGTPDVPSADAPEPPPDAGDDAVESPDTPDVPASPDEGGDPDTPPAPDAVEDPDAGDPDTDDPQAAAILVISEIMYDPKASEDSAGEWVELFNPSAAPVDLAGWTLRDNGSNLHVITGPAVVPAGGYAVLGNSGVAAENGGYAATWVYGEDFFLGNSGDSVVLEDPAGVIVDEVSYGVDAPWPSLFGGVSIELQGFGLDNGLAASWAPAVATFGAGDLGTPGYANGEPEPSFDLVEGAGDWQQPALKASLLFSPHDGLQDLILAHLASAQSAVSLAFFNIRLPEVLWALEDLMADGVAVDVVLDAKQQALEFNTMGEQLLTAGIPVTLVDNENAEDATMHHKVVVIDHDVVLTGSANLSVTALNLSDEDLLVVESADLAARFEAEIGEIKTAAEDEQSPDYAPGAAIRAWMGPEDDLDGKILTLLENAQSTALVAMFQLNQEGLVEALVDAHERGVNVLVILDELYLASTEPVEALQDAGVHVLLVQNTSGEFSEMHSKLMVVDHDVVAMGSYNWTNLASFHNDESLILIEDAHLAARAGGKIADLVAEHHDDAGSLGLTTGDQQVTFQVGNLTLHDGATLELVPVAGALSDPIAFTGTTATTTLPAGASVTYRYAVTGPSGVVTESGPTHRFTVPFAAGPYTVEDVFRP